MAVKMEKFEKENQKFRYHWFARGAVGFTFAIDGLQKHWGWGRNIIDI